jgi:hypothetical protein
MKQLLVLACMLLFAPAVLCQKNPLQEAFTPSTKVDPNECNAKVNDFFDAPASFWQQYWKTCPPEQVGVLHGEPIYLDRGDIRPRFLHGKAPKVPNDFQDYKGIVSAQIVIDKKGRVRAVKLLTAIRPEIDKAALDSINTYRFVPGKLNGKPVTVRMNVIIEFPV